MARWLVEVKSFAGDERLLRDLLAEFATGLTENSEGRYLESPTFETFGSPQEVRAKAKDIAERLEWPGKQDASLAVSLEVGSVLELVKDAPRRRHAFIDLACARLVFSGRAATLSLNTAPVREDERKRMELKRAEQEYQHRRQHARILMLSASNDKRATASGRGSDVSRWRSHAANHEPHR